MLTKGIKIIGTLLLLSLHINCLAQEGQEGQEEKEAAPQRRNEISVNAGFLQLKDKFNQGVVYNGVQFGVDYQRTWFLDKWELRYKPKIAFGISFSRSMEAIGIHFIPVDFSGIRTLYQKDNHTLKLGVNFVTNYNYQVYGDQHNSTRLFWFGEIGIAPQIEYSYQWKQNRIKIFVQNSLFGFVSRTENRSDYFYSFKFGDFFTQPHRNMKFGSFDKYNHIKAFVEYTPNILRKLTKSQRLQEHSFALGVEYIDYYFNNRFQSLNYYLQWRIRF